MKRTTERKWHSWLNGVALTICPSMWRRQRRLCWTSGGGTPLATPHWPSTARLWKESAALNSWGCTSRRISPGPPTPCHSPRRHNSAYTFYAGWKEQVSHHPSSPHSTGAPLRVCWPAVALSGTGTAVLLTARPLQRTVNTAAKIIGAPLPSILDIFLARCSSKTNSIVKDPTHPPTVSSSSYHQEDGTGASEPAPPDCSTAFSSRLWEPWTQITPPPSETPCNPYLWNMTPPPPPPLQNTPQPYHTKEKTELFLCNFKCATHRWVGLYKPPVVTHSPLCTRHFSKHCCVYTIPQKAIYVCYRLMHYKSSCTVPKPAAWLTMFLCTCTVFMWSIRIVCIVCIFYLYL